MSTDFESLLTGAEAHKYNTKRFHVGWIWTEVRGDTSQLSTQLESDMLHFEALRSAIASALSPVSGDRSKVAERWTIFLKPRIEMLDFWANLAAAIGALLGGGSALISIMYRGDKVGSQWWLAIGAGIAITFAILRFEIDRRKLWYKYITTHLEAISKLQ